MKILTSTSTLTTPTSTPHQSHTHPCPPHIHTHTHPTYTQPPCPVTQGTSLCTPTLCSSDICHSQSQRQHWENHWLWHVGFHVWWIPAPLCYKWPMDTDRWIQSPCLLGESPHSIWNHFYLWSQNIGFGVELVNPWYLRVGVNQGGPFICFQAAFSDLRYLKKKARFHPAADPPDPTEAGEGNQSYWKQQLTLLWDWLHTTSLILSAALWGVYFHFMVLKTGWKQ